MWQDFWDAFIYFPDDPFNKWFYIVPNIQDGDICGKTFNKRRPVWIQVSAINHKFDVCIILMFHFSTHPLHYFTITVTGFLLTFHSDMILSFQMTILLLAHISTFSVLYSNIHCSLASPIWAGLYYWISPRPERLSRQRDTSNIV